jgi:hypothetical protein
MTTEVKSPTMIRAMKRHGAPTEQMYFEAILRCFEGNEPTPAIMLFTDMPDYWQKQFIKTGLRSGRINNDLLFTLIDLM